MHGLIGLPGGELTVAGLAADLPSLQWDTIFATMCAGVLRVCCAIG